MRFGTPYIFLACFCLVFPPFPSPSYVCRLALKGLIPDQSGVIQVVKSDWPVHSCSGIFIPYILAAVWRVRHFGRSSRKDEVLPILPCRYVQLRVLIALSGGWLFEPLARIFISKDYFWFDQGTIYLYILPVLNSVSFTSTLLIILINYYYSSILVCSLSPGGFGIPWVLGTWLGNNDILHPWAWIWP